jgi:hypothetical protein
MAIRDPQLACDGSSGAGDEARPGMTGRGGPLFARTRPPGMGADPEIVMSAKTFSISLPRRVN